jgi:hypothetical protein
MPKEAFGGDDDASGGGDGGKKKITLSKFGLSPDTNIRDVFWKIMGAYAATRKPGVELREMENDRFSLMRVALSFLSNPSGYQYGLSPRFIAAYALMMMADGGWKDAFAEFLEKGLESRGGAREEITQAMRRLMAMERYKPMLTENLTGMLRGRGKTGVALAYIAGLESRELSAALKKELMIIARGDIGENQLNAIKAISLLRDEEDVRKSLIVLLSHWDASARLAAAEVLSTLSGERDVRAAAEKRLISETDEDVKKVLQKIMS